MSKPARILRIGLPDAVAGYLIGYRDGRNVFVFDDDYIGTGPRRPVLSLSVNDPNDEQKTLSRLRKPMVSRHALPPFFSNLLPEGMLRDYLVRAMKIRRNDEFSMLSALGDDLPGAVTARPVMTLPATVRAQLRDAPEPEAHFGVGERPKLSFSLGGAQLKFSMHRSGLRFTAAGRGSFIIKPPHPYHENVPENEYLAMRLAAAAGVEVPEIRLVDVRDVDWDSLPFSIRPPSERYAYAVRRFDRMEQGRRRHMEDFAQVLGARPVEEYEAASYDGLLRVLVKRFPHPERETAEFISRLAVHILLGNGDAHIKNWSVLYGDEGYRLSPAYDILVTIAYIEADRLALNLCGEKGFAAMDRERFTRLADRAGANRAVVLDALTRTVEQALDTWPGVLRERGWPKRLLEVLDAHWKTLRPPFAAVAGVRTSAQGDDSPASV